MRKAQIQNTDVKIKNQVKITNEIKIKNEVKIKNEAKIYVLKDVE